RCEGASQQLRIDGRESAANVLGECKCGIPVRFHVIVEDAANAAHFVAVLQEEVFVAPRLVFVVGRDGGVGVAGRLHGSMECDGVGIVLSAALVEHRSQIGATAKHCRGGNDTSGGHVHG